MSKTPSERDLAIVVYRDAGHTQKQTAQHFELSVGRIPLIEQRTRDHLEAVEAIKTDPDNLMLLARTGQLHPFAARGMERVGVHHLTQLTGKTFRDLLRLPNVNRRTAEALIELAAQRGIEIK